MKLIKVGDNMAYFRCIENGGGNIKKEKQYLGQLIERVSASTPKITSSSANNSYANWGAFNGVSPTSLSNPQTNTCWLPQPDEQNAWIQYGFDRLYWFNKIAIKCFSNYGGAWIGNIKILGSQDGANWENILANGENYELTAPLQTFATIEIDLKDSKEYQYIRLQADNNAFSVAYAPSCFFDELYVYGGIDVVPYVNFKQGTFTSASTQHGIVDINVGFKPDLVLVNMPFANGDTVSYWERGLNYASNHAVWCLQPAEGASYYVELGRTSGETGIQQINDDGFSFMSNGANTRDIVCSYIAIKYEKSTKIKLYSNGLYYPNTQQITDVSGFTKLYDDTTSSDYGRRGTRVESALALTSESTIATNMNGGWSDSHACFYDSENKIGAYGGYNFGSAKVINSAKFWIGRYSGQNNDLVVTIETLDANGNWNEVADFTVATDISYPVNIFEVLITQEIYGIRWIHKKTPYKTSGNNICFFGMTLYEGIGDSIGVYIPDKTGYIEIPAGYDGIGALVLQ